MHVSLFGYRLLLSFSTEPYPGLKKDCIRFEEFACPYLEETKEQLYSYVAGT